MQFYNYQTIDYNTNILYINRHKIIWGGLKLVKKIALFNHKDGVGKTTTTFNLGWMLAQKWKRVIVVDADPQSDLTGMILGYKQNELKDFYQKESNRNIRSGLSPAFESMPRLIEAVDCIEVDGVPGLYLLPGHIRLSEYDVLLGIAQELSGNIQTLQNLPGSINYLLEKTAEKFDAEYVLIDMGSGLSSISQNIFSICDFFIVPCSPDYFSVMAFDSLSTILEKWHNWAQKAQKLKILQEAVYPYPQTTPKFLGTIIQNYRLEISQTSHGFQNWVNEINKVVLSKLFPVLKKCTMILTQKDYLAQKVNKNYCLATIPDINDLFAISRNAKKPVFDLTKEQLSQANTGAEEQLIKKRDAIKSIFETLTNKILGLTK